jgi:hypothetical protein
MAVLKDPRSNNYSVSRAHSSNLNCKAIFSLSLSVVLISTEPLISLRGNECMADSRKLHTLLKKARGSDHSFPDISEVIFRSLTITATSLSLSSSRPQVYTDGGTFEDKRAALPSDKLHWSSIGFKSPHERRPAQLYPGYGVLVRVLPILEPSEKGQSSCDATYISPRKENIQRSTASTPIKSRFYYLK